MEINKNKLIIGVIWVILLGIVLFTVQVLTSTTNNTWNGSQSKDVSIWLYQDDSKGFDNVLSQFKQVVPKYQSTIVSVQSFSSYEEYILALSKAFISGTGPDIFMLNNNEKNSLLENQVLWIAPDVINPNDFRKKYKWVFSDDLITSFTDSEWKTTEFLKWIPVWYESLWVFYNRRYVKAADIESLSALNNTISNLKKKRPSSTPIALWNGSTVQDSADIITQFFLLDNEETTGLETVTWNELKQSLASYIIYGDESGDNNYNTHFSRLQSSGENNLDLFSKWEVYMVVWYPRMIQDIDKRGYSKNFLLASPFPHYFSNKWKTLINYNYFAINKDSNNTDFINDLLSYLSTDGGASNYIETYGYYLPALLSLESDFLDVKVSEKYNITLWDFASNYILSSFDKWIKHIYDRGIQDVLDSPANYLSLFNEFKSSTLCKARKVSTLSNTDVSCD